MKVFFALFLVFFCSSCQFFETEKIPSEVFYDEEKQTIDWNDVDQFPVFKSCSNYSEKEAQRTCFENTLNQRLLTTLQQEELQITTQEIIDTVLVHFTVSKEGMLSVKQMDLDSLTATRFPNFKEAVLNAISNLEVDAPAYKRGIPVTTSYTLPIVLQSN
ncbi:hypothetical protein [Patiriisocius hiemis]|uniref:TonB C-terminal domain-containing protein n=1 Tax=Patiriisocius hiemis TaxID=3075604 RepID=A0ABU2YF30_9FLAO|nr:hypothetical protein [Constantimarinum sp. W242]MDT0556352.1 hypothetical protein [Constantimarinum sp. W242]